MSPSLVTIDTSPDFNFGGTSTTTTTTKNGIINPSSARTLLLAPPSVASEGSLTSLLPSYDRTTTDLQMLDRLSAGLVTLPPATYDTILLLTSPDGARRAEAATLLSREVFAALVPAMKAGALLKTQDGQFFEGAEAREAVLAGLVQKEGGAYEKVEEEEVVMPLRFGKKKNASSEKPKAEIATNGAAAPAAHSSAGPAVDTVTVEMGGKPTTLDMVPPTVRPTPAGVGFDFGDDLDDDDGELIDEDELMTEEDFNRPIQVRMCYPRLPLPISIMPKLQSMFQPNVYLLRLTHPLNSPRVCPPAGQETPCLQRLYLRARRASRCRRQGASRQSGQGSEYAEAQIRGPERTRLHSAGQDG